MNSNRKTKVILVFSFVIAVVLMTDDRNAKADFTFGEPVNLGSPMNSLATDFLDFISTDGLEMYLTSDRSGGCGGVDIWISSRSTTDDNWGTPENLGPPVNTSYYDYEAYISSDGLELYFGSYQRPGGYGSDDIWVATRTTKHDPWGQPTNLGPAVNSSANDWCPSVSPDGLELYFTSRRSGGYGSDDIWVTRRATKNDPWGEPENLGEVVNSSASEGFPFLFFDGLVLIFSGERNSLQRPGGFGDADMWMTRRVSISDPWGTPVNLGPMVNSSSRDCGPRISPDGSTLFFSSERLGGLGGLYGDIYQAPIIPICDFNSDGKVDAADVCIMIEHWLTDYPLCDIGPMPWGDGIVDVQDLMVLAEHLFDGARPIANWKLDEEEGSTAYDSAGPYDADLHGGPVWQPAGGIDGGALLFDETDDYVSTPFILDPAAGSFSIFAWIKSSDKGQVIISQNDQTGTRWLWTDPSYGRLITWLMHPPFDPLMSTSTITDGQWHHVGLVYDFDTLIRRLYVDGVKVAQDTDVSGGVGSSGGLYFGGEKTLGAGTFFSGLIDDVRIYDQALSANEIAALAQ